MINTLSKTLGAQEKTQDIKQSLSMKIGTKPYARSRRNELADATRRWKHDQTLGRWLGRQATGREDRTLAATDRMQKRSVRSSTERFQARETATGRWQRPIKPVAKPLDRSVRSLSSSVRSSIRSLLWARFFAILCTAWFLSSCLDFAFGIDHQIITSPSSKSRLASYWTTKQSLATSLVQFGCFDHQTPKSKVNRPRVHFLYNLPLFGDWWQHDLNKQIIKILEFKNYLLARMQCKGQGYMMLKDTTCKHM